MGVKTDNSNLAKKIELREEDVKDGMKILDSFSGYGSIWNDIKTRHNIEVISIEKRDVNRPIFTGNNMRYLATMSIGDYDIIDLDAYGMATDQLELISSKVRGGQIIHFTFIVTGMGGISKKIKLAYGFTNEQLSQCSTIFNKKPFEQFLNYLYTLYGEKDLVYYTNQYDINSAKIKIYGKIYI